jgi:hypothetical protein
VRKAVFVPEWLPLVRKAVFVPEWLPLVRKAFWNKVLRRIFD